VKAKGKKGKNKEKATQSTPIVGEGKVGGRHGFATIRRRPLIQTEQRSRIRIPTEGKLIYERGNTESDH